MPHICASMAAPPSGQHRYLIAHSLEHRLCQVQAAMFLSNSALARFSIHDEAVSIVRVADDTVGTRARFGPRQRLSHDLECRKENR